jgi:hypothetical protein
MGGLYHAQKTRNKTTGKNDNYKMFWNAQRLLPKHNLLQ